MSKTRKLTPEIKTLILERISVGVPINRVCALVRISEQSHYNWINRGAEERTRLAANPRARPRTSEADFLDYVESVEKALEDAYVRNLSIIQQAARGGAEVETTVVEKVDKSGRVTARETTTKRTTPQWQAAAWYLERRYPGEFARTYKAEHTGKGGGPIEGVNLTRDEYKEMLADNLGRASHLADIFTDEDDLV